jgi:hypothetical protein
VRLLFLQAHRETDRFFAASGVQLVEHDRDQFHFPHETFSSQLKRRVDLVLPKSTGLRIKFNLDGVPITSRSHTHPSHSQTSRLLTSSFFIFRCSSSPSNPVYTRRVDSSVSVFSLSSDRHSETGFIFSSRFFDS